jgi:hypothetical protein
MNFAELTQTALLGTERQPLSQPKGERALDALQAQLDVNRREDALLACAALSGLHERIGSLAARDTGPVPEACAAEKLPRMNTRAGSLLLRLLAGEHAVLLPECLALAARANQIVLPEALPSLLKSASEKPELRETILPILGERGCWLARQNAAWTWVSGAANEDETIWQVGEGAARLLFLQRFRRTNPARARELLAATWKEEAPEERSRFVPVLEIGLQPEDEPFLEAALDDKRREVRRAAAALLGQLPESAFVRRMIERTRPLLKFVPGEAGNLLRLKKAKPAHIEITLPTDCDKAMQRDSIEPKPQQGFGEKIWWLIQMLEFVPLSAWTADWQTSPVEIITGSLDGEWKKELFEAWARAASRQKNGPWAEVLFGIGLEGKRFDKFEGLLAAMTPAQRELRLAELLTANDAKTRELHGTLVLQSGREWSVGFSRTVLAWMKRVTAEASTDWQSRNQLKDFAPRLAPATLAEALSGWPTDSPGWEFWSKGVDEFLASAQFRADLHTAFSQ